MSMEQFEYAIVTWPAKDDGSRTVAHLNELGAAGWEAVGVTPRAVGVPMPGLGAHAVSDVAVLLKRRVSG
jgi:hypothetical protein